MYVGLQAYTNADSFINKLSELFKESIKICDFKIMGITEVKPKNQRYAITPTELSLEEYMIYFTTLMTMGLEVLHYMYISHFALHRYYL